MDWYWWVLIGVGLVAIGYLKLKLFNKIVKKPKDKSQHEEED